jgi:hypothetical protein
VKSRCDRVEGGNVYNKGDTGSSSRAVPVRRRNNKSGLIIQIRKHCLWDDKDKDRLRCVITGSKREHRGVNKRNAEDWIIWEHGPGRS